MVIGNPDIRRHGLSSLSSAINPPSVSEPGSLVPPPTMPLLNPIYLEHDTTVVKCTAVPTSVTQLQLPQKLCSPPVYWSSGLFVLSANNIYLNRFNLIRLRLTPVVRCQACYTVSLLSKLLNVLQSRCLPIHSILHYFSRQISPTTLYWSIHLLHLYTLAPLHPYTHFVLFNKHCIVITDCWEVCICNSRFLPLVTRSALVYGIIFVVIGRYFYHYRQQTGGLCGKTCRIR